MAMPPIWHFDSASVAFKAKVDGRSLTCIATSGFLARFGLNGTEQLCTDGKAELRLFRENKQEIQRAAVIEIVAGKITANNEVKLVP